MGLYAQSVMSTTNSTVWQSISRVNQQAVLVQRFVKDATMFSFPDCSGCEGQRATLPDSIAAFDELVSLEVADSQADSQAEKMATAWSRLKGTLRSLWSNYQENQQVPESSTLVKVFNEAAEVGNYNREVAHWLLTSTETTTRVTLELLVPLPMTGSWTAGRSMRAAILVAQDLINTQQRK